MHQKLWKILSVCMATLLIFSLMPITTLADDPSSQPGSQVVTGEETPQPEIQPEPEPKPEPEPEPEPAPQPQSTVQTPVPALAPAQQTRMAKSPEVAGASSSSSSSEEVPAAGSLDVPITLAPRDIIPPPEPPEPPSDVTPDPEATYLLTVNYFYGTIENSTLSGTHAAQPYTATLKKDATYEISSPAIPGFTPDTPVVSGTMGEEAVVVNVTYNPGTSNYTVTHQFEKVDGTGYEAMKKYPAQNMTGLTGAFTTATPHQETGFVAQPVTQAAIAANGNTAIVVTYKRLVNNVTFSTNGGSYIDPVSLRYGETITLDTGNGGAHYTKRDGHSFGGWFVTEQLSGNKTTTVTMGTQPINLFAKWTAGKVDYTVVYMLQDPNSPDKYIYLTSETKNANVGTEVTVPSFPISSSSFVGTAIQNASMEIAGFQYKDSTKAKVAENGTTSIEVRLDRNMFSLRFFETSSKASSNKDKDLLASITAPYGANVLAEYLRVTQANHGNNPWKAIQSPLSGIRNIEVMPAIDWQIYKNTGGSYTYNTYYAFEPLAGSTTNHTYKNKSWVVGSTPHRVITLINQNATLDENASVAGKVEGFTYAGYVQQYRFSGKTGSGYVYYLRNNYKIDFIKTTSPNVVANTWPANISSQPFDSVINATVSTPQRPGYKFEGWYTNAQCTPESKFNFSTDCKMPAANLDLYAKWAPEVYEVTFALNWADEGAAENPATQTIDYLKLATNPAPKDGYVRPGYRFDGWLNGDKLYNFDRPVESSLNLVAKWTPDSTTYYTVHYVKQDGGEMFPSIISDKIYETGSTVTLEAKAAGDGEKFVPTMANQSIVLDGDGSKNVITFTYKAYEILPYMVQYLEEGTGTPLSDPKILDKNELNEVTETYKPISGYIPLSYAKRLVLVYEEGEIVANVIVFEYRAAAPGNLTVKHMVQNPDKMTEYLLKDTTTPEFSTGTTVTGSMVEQTYEGYTLKDAAPSSLIIVTNGKHEMVLRYDLNQYTLTYNNNPPAGSGITEATAEHGAPLYHGSSLNAKTFQATGLAQHNDYEFRGWGSDASGTVIYSADSPIPVATGATGDIVVFAQWEKVEKYTVTYHRNHTEDKGNLSFTDPTRYLGNASPNALALSATGIEAPNDTMIFAGWALESGATTATLNPGDPIAMGNANKDVYAVWRDKTVYQLKHNIGTDGAGNPITPYAVGATTTSQTVLEGSTPVAGQSNLFAVKDNLYTFSHWVDKNNTKLTPGASVSWTLFDENTNEATLTGVWQKNAANWGKVIYDINTPSGRTSTGAAPVDNTEYPVNTLVSPLKDKGTMAVQDALFLGWSQTKNSLITSWEAQQGAGIITSATVINPNVRLYAVWADNSYDETLPNYHYAKVEYTFGATGATGAHPVDTTNYLVRDQHGTPLQPEVTLKGSVGQATATYYKDDAVYIGWWLDDQAHSIITQKSGESGVAKPNSKTTLTVAYAGGSKTIYGAWAEDKSGDQIPDYEQYNITYMANNETAESYLDPQNNPAGKPQFYDEGNSIDILGNETTGFSYTKAGVPQIFAGWLDANGVTQYQPSDPYTFAPGTEKRVVLNAQWVNGYTVSYNSNGAPDTVAVPSNSSLYPAGAEVPVDTANINPNYSNWQGFTFLGWSTDAAATTATYGVGASISLIGDMPEENVTLYAIWEANFENITFNPTYAGTSVVYDSQAYGATLAGQMDTDTIGQYNIAGQASQGTSPTFTDVNLVNGTETPYTVSVEVSRKWTDASGTERTFTKELTAEILITQRPLTVQPENFSTIYNGTAQTANGAPLAPPSIQNNAPSGLVQGHILDGSASRSETDAGLYKLAFAPDEIKVLDNNISKTHNYKITTVESDFQIAPLALEITANNGQEPYDTYEKSLPDPLYTLTGAPLPAGHLLEGVTGKFTQSGSDATALLPGSYDVILDISTIAISNGGQPVKDTNFTITKTDGTFNISATDIPLEWELIGGNEIVTYNGQNQSVTSYEVLVYPNGRNNGTARTDFKTTSGVEMSATGGRDAKPEPYTVSLIVNQPAQSGSGYTLEDEFGNDVTPFFPQPLVTDGSITITPKSAVVRVPDVAKIYGSADPALNANVSGLVEGDKLNVTLKRTQGENVGTYPLSLAYKENTNYNFTEEVGKLTISPRNTVLVANSHSKVQGETDPAFSAYVHPNYPLATWDKSLNYSLYRFDGEQVGIYDIQFNVGKNPNYIVNVVKGSLEITTAPTSGSSSTPTSSSTTSTTSTSTSTTPGGGAGTTTTTPAGGATALPTTAAPTPVTAVITPAGVPITPPVPVETIPDPEVPTTVPEVENIEEPPTPMATMAQWALLNLLIALLTLILSILLVVTLFKRNNKANADYQESEDEANQRNAKSGMAWRVLSILSGILAPILFLLTENTRNPMVFVDKWTLFMVLLFAVQMVGMLLLRRARNQENNQNKQNPNNA